MREQVLYNMGSTLVPRVTIHKWYPYPMYFDVAPHWATEEETTEAALIMLEDQILYEHPDDIAMISFESVVGGGGVIVAPTLYRIHARHPRVMRQVQYCHALWRSHGGLWWNRQNVWISALRRGIAWYCDGCQGPVVDSCSYFHDCVLHTQVLKIKHWAGDPRISIILLTWLVLMKMWSNWFAKIL